MKKIIKLTESQLKKMVENTIKERKSIDDFYDLQNDDIEDEDYNELDSLFNTEHDYDGETLRGDESGFSNNMRQNQIKYLGDYPKRQGRKEAVHKDRVDLSQPIQKPRRTNESKLSLIDAIKNI